MVSSKILLSSCERKALFRASQQIIQADIEHAGEFADDLCEKLDDGGIWNPCFLTVNDRDETSMRNPGFPFRIILKSGQKNLPEYSHSLKMIEDRWVYTNERSVNKNRNKTAPFLTRNDYYGPNWDSVRREAIIRDGKECKRCGMRREAHKEKYGQDLHVHHITPLREIGNYLEANKLQNLETLCARCHEF
jgi:ribosomal protein S27AE